MLNFDLLPESAQNMHTDYKKAIIKRARAIAKSKGNVVWVDCIAEVESIYNIIKNTCLFFNRSGGGEQYLHTVVFELVAYKIDNVDKVCEQIKRTYGQTQSKAMPSLPDWRDAVMAVKSSMGYGLHSIEPVVDPISEDEKAEVSEMIQELYNTIGEPDSEGEYRNRISVLRHGGIYKQLAKGLVQVYTDEGAVWVEPYEVGNRVEIDHSKSVELVHTGRIDMKRYEEYKRGEK